MVADRTDVIGRRPAARVAALACAALTLVACSGGTDTTTGTPTTAAVDLQALDVGGYNVQPIDVEANRTPTDGRILEGIRMAGAIVYPHLLDATLTHDWGSEVIPTPATASDVAAVSNVNIPTLERHGLITGFDVTEGDAAFGTEGAAATRVFLMRFPDAATATAAALDLQQTDFAVSPDNRPLSIPGYPDAHAHWRPGIPTMSALYARDQLVVSIFVQHPRPFEQQMVNRVADVLDAQVPLIDGFEPTPVEGIDQLPRDPEEILRRTLIQGPADQTVPISGTDYASWAGPAVIRFRPLANPELETVWDDGGVDAVGYSAPNMVFRFRDADAAEAFADAWQRSHRAGVTPIDGPAGLAQARCAERPDTADQPGVARCFVTNDRYGAFLTDGSADRARQMAAAQYALLENSE